MAAALYTMSRPLPIKSPERKEWLKKSIAAYHRTLAVDSEDVGAHYGLGLAFGDPAWGARTLGDSAAPAGEAADDRRSRRAGNARRLQVADRKLTPSQRKERALELARLVTRYMKGVLGLGSSQGWNRCTTWQRHLARSGSRRKMNSFRTRSAGRSRSLTRRFTSGSSQMRRPRAACSRSPARTTPPPT